MVKFFKEFFLPVKGGGCYFFEPIIKGGNT